MEPDAKRGRSLELIIDPGTVWPEIVMIEHGGSSAQGKFDESQRRGHPHVIRCHPRPDRVERSKPVEETGVLRPGDDSGQRLIQMMMGVHQARQHNMTRKVHYLVSLLG